MNRYLDATLDKIMHAEPSAHRFAGSCCLGIFMACSPLFGIQIIVSILLSKLLRLNTTVVIIVLCLINNPLTMIPIVIIDYITGYIIIERILGCDLSNSMPFCFTGIDTWIKAKLAPLIPHMNFSLSYYLIGGFIFAALCSIPAYPVLYALFNRLRRHYIEHEDQAGL